MHKSFSVANFGDRALSAAGAQVRENLTTDLRQTDFAAVAEDVFLFRQWDQSET